MPKPNPSIQVFKPGTFSPMGGGSFSYSEADVKAIADSYDAEQAPAPVVVGHPAADSPAFGWVKSFSYDEASQKLFAHLGDLAPAFVEAVKGGAYKKISMALFSPDAPNNPKPGVAYPKHVGFLGGAAPAVPGLEPVAFAEGEEGALVFEFAGPDLEAAAFESEPNDSSAVAFTEWGFKDSSSLFRSLRDWVIGKFGLEAADQALPSHLINWIDDAADQDPPASEVFAEDDPRRAPLTKTPKETEVLDPQTTPEFAERQAALEKREADLAAKEQKIAHEANAAFAERLVSEGKLIPGSKDKLTGLLNALPSGEVVSFAEGEAKATPRDALAEIFSAQPQLVEFGEQDLGEAPGDESDSQAFAEAIEKQVKSAADRGQVLSAADAAHLVTQGSKT